MKSDGRELIAGVEFGPGRLPIIAGPCVIESESQTLAVAEAVRSIRRELAVPIIFKASFDKANRSSVTSFRGPGLEDGLRILAAVREGYGLPLLTDVHEPSQCEPAAAVCDVLQIPAFLCRQTDLVQAAAATGRPLNLKKGQFLAPEDILLAVEKARKAGARRVSVTERGVCFGYHNLVVDMRSFAILRAEGIDTIYDVTHSLQLPGAAGTHSGGQRQFAEPLARAAVAAGAAGLYLEVHTDPDSALSDSATQLPPECARDLIAQALRIRRALADAAPETGSMS